MLRRFEKLENILRKISAFAYRKWTDKETVVWHGGMGLRKQQNIEL
jgi:hypothetical protein